MAINVGMSNPPNKRLFWTFAVFGFYLIAAGLMFLIFFQYWFGSLISFIFGILSLFTFWWTIYVTSPRFVTISDDGFLLRYQNGKSRTVPWAELYAVFVGPELPSRVLKTPPSSTIKINGQLAAIGVNNEIAKEIREGYFGRMGKYPLDIEEYKKKSLFPRKERR